MKVIIRFWPLIFLFVLIGFLFLGLHRDPRNLPSALIDKPILEFNAPDLLRNQSVSPKNYKGQYWFLNVWASWCTTCAQENAYLLELKSKGYRIVGLDYKDNPQLAKQWLYDMGGNPYEAIALDQSGSIGIDLGVYGVPETFLISPQEKIIARYAGALDEEVFQKQFLEKMKPQHKP